MSMLTRLVVAALLCGACGGEDEPSGPPADASPYVGTPGSNGQCGFFHCSSVAADYSCASSSRTQQDTYNLDCSDAGEPYGSTLVITYDNGRVVTCNAACSGYGGICQDDTGATCEMI